MKHLKAVFPGSFDPITYGHIDLIKRMAPLFEELVVLVGQSRNKKYLCETTEREYLAKTVLKEIPNVKVEVCPGLTVDYAKKNKIAIILRGLRGVVDSEFEFTMAAMNQKLNSEIETIMVCSSPQYAVVSSSLIKEIVVSGGNVDKFVPKIVGKALKEKLLRQK